MDLYTIGWLLWLGAFFALEIPALLNKQLGDTLTEHILQWASMTSKGPAWRVRRLGLLTLLAWLSAHFLSGGRF